LILFPLNLAGTSSSRRYSPSTTSTGRVEDEPEIRFDTSPARSLFRISFAHGIEHIDEMLKGRRGLGWICHGDFTLQLRLQKIFIALHFHISDEVGVDHKKIRS